ncbi:MAG: NADH-quinone oxidoreductase subunit M, partial [Actinomycetota bacterium]|nr:NADH-quinone oxidoreductase subunit M [Actinomycetota bacterium]
ALLSAYNPAPTLGVGLFRTLMVLGGVGTILTAGYFLWMLQRVNLGRVPDRWEGKQLHDVTMIEYVSWAPLLVGTLLLGVVPVLIFGMTTSAVASLSRLFA